MRSFLSTEGLARTATRHPWLVIGAWAVLLVAGFFGASGIGSVLTTDQKVYDERDSQRAVALIEERFHQPAESNQEFIVVQSNDRTMTDPAFKSLVTAIVAGLQSHPAEVERAVNYYVTPDPSLVSADQYTLLIPATLRGEAQESAKAVIDTIDGVAGKAGFLIVTGGHGSIQRTWMETGESDLQKAEVLGLPIALVILVVVFGAAVAAGLPLVLGLISIIVALGIAAIIGRAFELSTFVLNMISMIGLAVGIDYSLIIVQRFREERRNGFDRDAAITRAGATATRAVLFSGATVVVALAGMLLVPDSIFRSLGTGAIVVVIVAVLAAMTLLPAVLRLLGDRVNAGRLRIPFRKARSAPAAEGGRFWTAVTNFVTRHAVISVVASVGLLLAAAVPYLTIELGSSGVDSLPHDSGPYQAFSILRDEFNAGLIAPTDVVVEAADTRAPQVQSAIDGFVASLKTNPAFGEATVTRSADNTLARISFPAKGDGQGELSKQVLADLRGRLVPAAFGGVDAKVYVNNPTAQAQDYRSIIDHYTPIVFAFVLGLSFLILMVVFRSIVVPVKAMIMNLLSVGAAYGLMVLVFQHGYGVDLFGFSKVPTIESWVPLFMFAVLFGLSMDYHVFLLSRIREHFDQTGDNLASVAHGVRTTAGMITGAALIMVAVFSGFASGQLVMFQQMGFGLAVAVLIDATIIRTVLVPASMALLGDRNWYLPSWLGWLPRVDVEGHLPSLRPERPAASA